MKFLEEFKQRGYFYQCTNEDNLSKLDKLTAYIGFDCTAKSLHVGSLMQIMILRLLQKHGFKPIVVLGGGTTKIGDPSGKDEARKLITQEIIDENKNGIFKTISKFLKFGNGNTDAIMIDNSQWLDQLNYLDFLSKIGRLFSINRMLSFDSVKLRLEREQNLSFLEFNYMILQAYDFVELYKLFNCRLQIGGSDQWGNIINGVELGHKIGIKEELYGLTTPLITTASGAKMGKTASGAVWLDETMFSPYEYYQFWRNTDDKDVIKFMLYFTDLSLDEINNYKNLKGSELNQAKKLLAYEATKICHGENAALDAMQTAENIFERNNISGDLPKIELSKNEIINGVYLYKNIVDLGFAKSGGEARRLIEGNAVKINDKPITDANFKIDFNDLNSDNIMIISVGKKKFGIIALYPVQD